MTNEEKEKRFKHPGPDEAYLARWIVSDVSSGSFRVLSYIGKQNSERPLIAVAAKSDLYRDGHLPLRYFTGTEGYIESIATAGWNGEQYIFQSTYRTDKKQWNISADLFSVESGLHKTKYIYSSAHPVCYLKSKAIPEKGLFLCWQEIRTDIVRIYGGIWNPKTGSFYRLELSEPDFDAFRPDAAVDDTGNIWLTWDRFRKGQYEIVIACTERESFASVRHVLRGDEEDWNAPRIAAAAGELICVWRGTREVSDDLGIFERWSYIKGVKLAGEEAVYFKDPGHPEDSQIIADLKEGLLPRELSKGYVGLRRNPQLFFLGEDAYIGWEVRPENTKTSIMGQLVCRPLLKDNTVGKARVVHRGGYCYSLPKKAPLRNDDLEPFSLPVAFFTFENEDREILQAASICPNSGDSYILDHDDWKRWKSETEGSDREAISTSRYSVDREKGGGREYQLFWADTHCHALMSPDAEGDPDELIHYAMHRAGIDILGIVDNDFYPHKTLTRSEWEIKKALAHRYSRKYAFLCPPSYEYTYHDTSLKPDFNHRCVLHFLGGELIKRTDSGNRNLEQFLKRINPEKSLVYSHHCSYQIINPDVVRNTEVVSSWRICLEETEFTIDELKKGRKLGFIGSSDTHRQVPGRGGALTGVYAEELTPKAILEAYYNRRIIATSGSKVMIDFRINGAFIGTRVKLGGPAKLELYCRVKAPRDIETVTIVKNGARWRHFSVSGNEEEISLRDSFNDYDTNNFYFVRVKLKGEPSLNMPPSSSATTKEAASKDGEGSSLGPFTNQSRYPHNLARGRGVFAWTSPIWVERVERPKNRRNRVV